MNAGATPEALPSGVVTFLFTDIEGSTRRWEADPEVMRAALADHDEVLRTASHAPCAYLISPQKHRTPSPATKTNSEQHKSAHENTWSATSGRIAKRTSRAVAIVKREFNCKCFLQPGSLARTFR